MSTDQFDEALRDIISEEHIPYNEKNWNVLQQRLDKKENKKLLFFLPFIVSNKAAAAAVVFAIATIGTWLLLHRENKPVAPIASVYNTATDQVTPSAVVVANDSHNTAALHKSNTVSKPIVTKREETAIGKASPSDLAATNAAINNVVEKMDEQAIANEPAQVGKVATLTQAPKQQNTVLQFASDEYKKQQSGISLALNGGVSPSANNYSAGVTVRKKLSNTFSLETGIAYARGDMSTMEKFEMPDAYSGAGSSNGDVSAITDARTITVYQQQTRNVPFIQFTPSLGIKLHSRLHSSAGADFQKALIDNGTRIALNEKNIPAFKKIPAIDPGFMLSLNYAITKRIGGGLAYRQSILNLGNNSNYASRDYLLFQVQYTIIK